MEVDMVKQEASLLGHVDFVDLEDGGRKHGLDMCHRWKLWLWQRESDKTNGIRKCQVWES